jgi:hypothetical protein
MMLMSTAQRLAIAARARAIGDERNHAACFWRFAILAMVARLQPVAACMELQDWPTAIISAMPALRSTFSARPL